VVKLLAVLDIAWEDKYSIYEAALLAAYSFAGGLYNEGELDRADALIKEKILPIQNAWTKKGIVRPELVDPWPQKLAKRAAEARG